MSRKNKIGLIGFVLLIMILIVWLSNGSSKSGKSNAIPGKPNAVVYSNWDDKYALSSKEPMGLYHWSALLQLHLDNKQSITTIDYLYSIDTIPGNTNPTFLFIGDYFALFTEEADAILKRVKEGANLFIAQEQMDKIMYNKLDIEVTTNYYFDTTITVATNKKTYNFYSLYQGFPVAKKWRGNFNVYTEDSVDYVEYSGIGKLANSYSIKYGKGRVFINTTPELFTNYQLLTKDGYDYSKIWLDEIPKNESVYWIEMARYEPPVYDPYKEFKEQEEQDSNYLQFIFQDKTRIIAMLLLLGGIIIFLLFRAKRMQPLVPFIPKKRNMTLIFANTITSIYFNQRNPFTLVKIQRENFYSIIQKHFNIDLSKEDIEKEIAALAQKSNVSEEQINDILSKLRSQKQHNTSESDLTELRKMILNFYRTSGLISSKVQEKLESKTYIVYRNEWLSGALIFLGLGLITLGTYYLIHAIAIGVLLWPIGFIPIIIGTRRLMRPFIEWSNKEISISPLIGKKKVFNLEELSSVYQDEKQVQLYFTNDTVRIYFWELNGADAKQLKHFANAHNKLK